MKNTTKPKSDGSNRGDWRYREAATEFRKRHGFKPFTMVPHEVLEAEMMDAGLHREARALAGIRRLAWGNLSDYAVDGLPKLTATDPTPQVVTQQQLSRILNIPESSISEACKFLKANGYLRKDSDFLFPEQDLKSLESTKNSGVSSDSTNSNSPYLRFREGFLSTQAELAKIIAQREADREQYWNKAKELSQELKKTERVILGAFRDFRRENPEIVKQWEAEQESTQPTDTPAQSETEAKRTETHTSGVDTNSNPEQIQDSKGVNRNSETRKSASNGKQKAAPKAPLKPIFKGEKDAHREGVSQSVVPLPDSETDRPTDPHARILAAIPPALTVKLGDIPSGPLLRRIAAKLNGAPIEDFTAKIEERFSSITGLGILEKLAADVASAHAHNQQFPNASPPKPMNRQDAKREELRRGMEAMDRMRERIG